MRAITVFRAAAWLGFAVVAGALVLVRWGVDPGVSAGPPAQFERAVVGAAMLAFAAALAISLSGRGERPPSWAARGVGGVCAALVVVIAGYVYRRAHADGFPSVLAGQGWTWLLCGGGIAVGALIGTLGLKPAEAQRRARARRRKKR